MIWNKLRGHQRQIEMLRRSVRRSRLPHALLFVGPEGVGKSLFARSLAQCLLCERHSEADLEACGECPSCRQMAAGSHPDFLTAGCPEGKNEIPIELFVGTRERRGREGLCYDLSLHPMTGNRKVAAIDDAHLLNEASANALLKTLEEPPPFAVLILIATSADDILPTIRSRCQQVRFDPLAEGDLAELLVDLGVIGDRAEAAAVAAISDGSLSIARQLLQPELRALRDELFAALTQCDRDSLGVAHRLIEGLEKIGDDSQQQRRDATWMLRFMIDFFRRAVRALSTSEQPQEPVLAAFVARYEAGLPEHIESMISLIERTALAERQLAQYAPVPLCLEALFDDLGRLMRGARVSEVA